MFLGASGAGGGGMFGNGSASFFCLALIKWYLEIQLGKKS
jgi:hypothetical protein